MPIDPSSVQQARKNPDKVQHGHFTMPLWAWAVVGGVGLFFIYKVYEARKSSAVNGTATSTQGAVATGCVDNSGNPTPCPVYVPVPTATPTGSGPSSNSDQLKQIMDSIQSIQGQVSTLTTTLTPGMADNLASNLNQIENDLEGTNYPVNATGAPGRPAGQTNGWKSQGGVLPLLNQKNPQGG